MPHCVWSVFGNHRRWSLPWHCRTKPRPTKGTKDCLDMIKIYILLTLFSSPTLNIALRRFLFCYQIIFGAFGLPFGLIMTLATGGELFTGNTALVTAAYKEGKIEAKDLAKSWITSYIGNFVGSLLLAYLAYKSGTLGNGPAAAAIATAKSSLPWGKNLPCGKSQSAHIKFFVDLLLTISVDWFSQMLRSPAEFFAIGWCAWAYTWHLVALR